MSQNAVSKRETPITDVVLSKINDFEKLGQLNLPPNYSAPNALKAAWLELQTVKKGTSLAIDVCSKDSVANALFNMVTDGLSVAKKQCYFVPYGNDLQYIPSYMGNIAIAKRVSKVKDVTGNVVYEGDKDGFKFGVDLKTGRKQVFEHTMDLDSIDNNKITGAYAIITYEDGSTKAEIMTIAQIKQAWMQGATKGQSPAHKNFPDQMAIRTVINRALKLDNASSNDAHLNVSEDGSINESSAPQEKDRDIKEVNIEEAEVVEDTKPVSEPKQEDPLKNSDTEPTF